MGKGTKKHKIGEIGEGKMAQEHNVKRYFEKFI